MKISTLHTSGFTETQAVRIIGKWKGDANLRKEWGYNFKSFMAFCSGVLAGTRQGREGETDWLTKA